VRSFAQSLNEKISSFFRIDNGFVDFICSIMCMVDIDSLLLEAL